MVSGDARAIVARFPTTSAAFWRMRRKAAPIDPRPDLGHAANYLYMLTGEAPDAERVRALETYLNHRGGPRPQRLDVHGSSDHVDGIRSGVGRGRRDGRAQGAASRRRAGAGARHGVRDRRAVTRGGDAREKIESARS